MRQVHPHSILAASRHVSPEPTREPPYVAALQAAQARARAEALHGDPLSAEAAGRAYRVAESRILLHRLVHAVRGILRPARPSIQGEGPKGGSGVAYGP